MSNEISITVPAISPELIETIQTESTVLYETETQAFAALKEKYSLLAKHNGFIKVGWESQSTSNSSWSREAYYRLGSKRLRGLLCDNSFYDATNRGDQNRGTYGGTKLYLTESGEWLEIKRSGSWSHWQGEREGWACGEVEWDDSDDSDDEYNEYENSGYSGCIETLSDTEVAERYKLPDVLEQIRKTLGDMSTKLPERLTQIRQRAEIASKLLQSLK